MLQMWADAFDVPRDDTELEDRVTTLLFALRAEIKLTRTLLQAHEVPDRLFQSAFDRFAHSASPGQIHTSWAAHRGALQSPEVRSCFAWCSWALRSEAEEVLTTDAIQALYKQIDELEEAIATATISEFLKAFLTEQTSAIRRALDLYRVSGARPINAALKQVVGAFKTEETELRKQDSEPGSDTKTIMGKAADVITKVAKVADGLSKIKKAGEDTVAIAKPIADLLLPYLQN